MMDGAAPTVGRHKKAVVPIVGVPPACLPGPRGAAPHGEAYPLRRGCRAWPVQKKKKKSLTHVVAAGGGEASSGGLNNS